MIKYLTGMSSIVPVIETPLLEAKSELEIHDRFNMMMSAGDDRIPAFVIRSSELKIIDSIIRVARHYMPDIEKDYIFPFHADSTSIGNLHTDGESGENKPTLIHVHTTHEGSGNAYFSPLGKVATLANVPEYRAQAHRLFLEKLVNTNVMSPIVGTTRLEAGDTVVFPVGGNGVWHRFDTDSHRFATVQETKKSTINKHSLGADSSVDSD